MRFLRKTIFTVVFVPFPLFGLWGTVGILEGRVIDKQTKEPMAGVNVVVGRIYGGVTNEKGEYRLVNIRSGVYDIRYSIVGYKSVIMKDVAIPPDLKTRIEVELEVSAIEGEAVEVRAERPLIQTDQASTAFSVGEVKLERLSVVKFQDVLSLQPGTTVEGNVRGGKISEVVFLIDGLPTQDLIGGGLGANLPKSSITGIAIHTGGFEAEYGNAMSGVVNVITRGGGEKHEIRMRYERDNWLPGNMNRQQDGATELEMTVGGPLISGEVYYFAANYVSTSDTRWREDLRRFFSSPVSREYSGFGKIEYVVSPTLRLNGQLMYSINHWRDYEFSWRFNLDGLPARSRNSYRATFTLSNTISQSTFYTATLSTFFLNSQIGEGIKDQISLEPYEYDFFLRYVLNGSRSWWATSRQITLTSKADLTSEVVKGHLVKMGLEFNQYKIFSDLVKYEPRMTYFGKPLSGEPLLNYSNTYEYGPRSGSIYVQDKITFEQDGTNLSVGARWDFFDPTAERPIVEFIPTSENEYQQVISGNARATFKHQVSPRLSFAAPVEPGGFFFVNFGHYFQFPLFSYLYSGVNTAQVRQGVKNVQAGNPDLKPERSIAWEVGFKYKLNENDLASATYFKKQFLNQIDSKTLVAFDSKVAGDYGFATYINNAEANSTGLELVLSRQGNQFLTGSVSYTYMATEGLSDYVDQSLNYAQWGFPLALQSYPLSWDQTHTLKADVDFKLFNSLQTNVIVMYNSPRPYSLYPTRDGFTPVDSARPFVPNNARMSDVLFVNAKLSVQFALGKENQYKVTLYANAHNVLNRKNVRWIDSSGRIGGELGDPGAYYEPRRLRLGLSLDL